MSIGLSIILVVPKRIVLIYQGGYVVKLVKCEQLGLEVVMTFSDIKI